MRRIFGLMIVALGLSGCTLGQFQTAPVADLGDFSLGHNIVIAPNPHKGPGSREATPEELIAAVEGAIENRFRAYDGDKLYNLGLSIDGYGLAEAGVPVVLAPKSVLILHVTLWDDAAGEKLNEEAHQIIILEDISAKSIFGSGFFNTGDQQLNDLARKAAVALEEWMQENGEWFGIEPVAEEQASDEEPDE